MFNNRWLNKEAKNIHKEDLYSKEYNATIRKDEIMSFGTKSMELDVTVVSEIRITKANKLVRKNKKF